jgi:hypothetical protein
VPRFSANITTLFREVQFIERIGLAAAAGFDAIEIQFPYDQDPAVLRDELEAQNLPLVLMNFPVGDLMAGGEGLAAVPGRQAELERALSEARTFAEVLRPTSMNLLSGRPDPRHDPANCREVFESSLRQAGLLTRELGIQLLTEPVNNIDQPGFFLSTEQQAMDLIAAMPDIDLFFSEHRTTGNGSDSRNAGYRSAHSVRYLPHADDGVRSIYQFARCDRPGRAYPVLGPAWSYATRSRHNRIRANLQAYRFT